MWKNGDYFWPKWDAKDGFGEHLTHWGDFVDMVEDRDMPAGLLELECLAHRYHVRAAVLSPERQQIILSLIHI
eukprot:1884748-Prorocentrum_lima.AAC.1